MSTSENNNHKESYDSNHRQNCEDTLIINQNDSSMKAYTPIDDKKMMLNDIENNSNSIPKKSISPWMLTHMILVVIASSTINGVVFGVVNNFGVFYVSLIELFKADTSLLSLTGEKFILGDNQTQSPPPDDTFLQPLIAGVGSLNIGLIFFCSIFASVLSDRYGIRNVCVVGGVLSTIGMYASSVSVNLIYLYVTYGLVLGIGASLVYAPSLAILGHYFDRKLGLVNGLVTAGSSGFSIVMPFVLRWLINGYGVQNTFKWLTIPMVALILAALTFEEKISKNPNDNQNKIKGRSESKQSLSAMFFFEELWHNKLYLCWVIAIPAGLFGYFVPFCHLVKHAQDIKSAYSGEFLIMCIGLFSLLGRLISGPIADLKFINRIVLQLVAFASIGALTITLTMVRDEALVAVVSGLGLFDGFFISLLGPIAFDLVGPAHANQAIGLLLCFCSLPLLCGPPVAAYVYGLYGNYNLAFFLAGLPPIVAASMMLITMQFQKRDDKKSLHPVRERAHSIAGKFSSIDELKVCNGNGSNKNEDNGEKIHLLDKANASPKIDTQKTTVVA